VKAAQGRAEDMHRMEDEWGVACQTVCGESEVGEGAGGGER
jgi:hypothetical protein